MSKWGPKFENRPVSLKEFLEDFPLNHLYYRTAEGRTVLSNLEKPNTDELAQGDSGQEICENGQENRGSGQEKRDSGQEKRESGQENRESGQEEGGQKPFWTTNNLAALKMLFMAEFKFKLAGDAGSGTAAEPSAGKRYFCAKRP